MRQAVVVNARIRTLFKLSLHTALALLETKIAPVAAYPIEIIWERLSSKQLIRFKTHHGPTRSSLSRCVSSSQYAAICRILNADLSSLSPPPTRLLVRT